MVIDLPARDQVLEGSSAFSLHPSSQLDVFRSDTSEVLKTKSLSWRTKPGSLTPVATVTPQAGEQTVVSRFPCPRGTLHTFEIACAGNSHCLVDVWSSQNYTWGMFSKTFQVLYGADQYRMSQVLTSSNIRRYNTPIPFQELPLTSAVCIS